MIVSAIVGDFYGEGHGYYERISVDINKTPDEWEKAFREMESSHEYNFRALVCGQEGINHLEVEEVDYLKSLGVSFEGLGKMKRHFEWEDGATKRLTLFTEEALVEILMSYVKVKLPSLEWSFPPTPRTLIMGIGYGLFE